MVQYRLLSDSLVSVLDQVYKLLLGVSETIPHPNATGLGKESHPMGEKMQVAPYPDFQSIPLFSRLIEVWLIICVEWPYDGLQTVKIKR